jgi:hypothetical protein
MLRDIVLTKDFAGPRDLRGMIWRKEVCVHFIVAGNPEKRFLDRMLSRRGDG